MNHCPHCGERVEPRDAYCFECGEELSGGADGTDTNQGIAGNGEGRPRGESGEPQGMPPGQDRPPEGQPRSEAQTGRENEAPAGQSRGQRRRSGGARETGGRPRENNGYGQERGEYRQERGEYRQEGVQHETSGRVESLTTLWVAAGLSVLALVESLSVIVFADEVVGLVEDSGFGGDVSAETIAVTGGLGLVVALVLVGLCLYYYRQGYVERRFFWGLIVGGGVGLLFGSGISFLVLIVVGGYGLLVVLKRDRPGERPSRV